MAKERYHATPRDCIDWFREEYEFLSNFYPAKMLFDGIAYENAESAYQAHKLENSAERMQFSCLFGDEAKKLGKTVTVRPDWEEVKLETMERIVEAKFTQNPRLANQLVQTGNLPLIEGNLWADTFWGINRKTGQGENHLGKILMALRQRFQTEGIPEGQEYTPSVSLAPSAVSP